jgi:uncharacterized protein (TIGR03435 family)
MTWLAKALAERIHRTVVDTTGLIGNFDLQMQWSKDDGSDAGEPLLDRIHTWLETSLAKLSLKSTPADGV